MGLIPIEHEFNDINGGSVAITLGHKEHNPDRESAAFLQDLNEEFEMRLKTEETWKKFINDSLEEIHTLREFITTKSHAGKSIAALGASTKGNMILHLLGDAVRNIKMIGDVNPEKIGGFTPVGSIPIVSQEEVLDESFDYLIVLPWHFRKTFLDLKINENSNSRLVFPLPNFEVV